MYDDRVGWHLCKDRLKVREIWYGIGIRSQSLPLFNMLTMQISTLNGLLAMGVDWKSAGVHTNSWSYYLTAIISEDLSLSLVAKHGSALFDYSSQHPPAGTPMVLAGLHSGLGFISRKLWQAGVSAAAGREEREIRKGREKRFTSQGGNIVYQRHSCQVLLSHSGQRGRHTCHRPQHLALLRSPFLFPHKSDSTSRILNSPRRVWRYDRQKKHGLAETTQRKEAWPWFSPWIMTTTMKFKGIRFRVLETTDTRAQGHQLVWVKALRRKVNKVPWHRPWVMKLSSELFLYNSGNGKV